MSDLNQGTYKMVRNFEKFFMALQKVWSIILYLLNVLKAIEIKHLIGKCKYSENGFWSPKKLC